MGSPVTSVPSRTASALTLAAFAAAAHAQKLPPRQIGSLDVDAATTAPLRYARTVEVDADPEAVFDHLSTDANWPGWFDGIDGVSRDGDARRFSIEGGGEIAERIVAFDAPSTFAWSLADGNPFGVENHLGVLHVTPDEEDGEGSIVSLDAFFDHPDLDTVLPAVESGAVAILDGIVAEFGGRLLGEAAGTSLVTILATRVVDAPREAVWQVVAEDFADVAEWASVISEATFAGGDQDPSGLLGGQRQCFIPAFGSSVKERVVAYDETSGEFAYEVVEGMPPFVTKGYNTWTIEAIDADTTRASATTTMRIAPGTPGSPVGAAKANFAHVLSISLDELVHFVETGEPHPRELASR